MTDSIFDTLGSKPTINARGIYSTLGGAIFSPRVMAAIEAANRSYVDMDDLLTAAGRVIANLLGAEAAYPTPGAAAALALGAAACITRGDGARLEQLPDTSGLPDEVLIQRRHRYRYDRNVRVSGAQLVEAGDERGTTLEQLAAVIGPRTGAICFPAHLDGAAGTVALDQVQALARERDVPLLVDAAFLVYPIERMQALASGGADLVCFSAKYMGGPNAAGFVCGRRRWVDAFAAASFTSFELSAHRVFGRPFKLDRHAIAATVVALQEWLETDHDARLEGYERKVQAIGRRLHDVPGVELTPMCFTMEETLAPEPINSLHVRVTPATGTTAEVVAGSLRAANPSIATQVVDDAVVVVVETLLDGEEEVVAERLRSELRR
jgi:L-seryl-tRNA(Ser) seleniumtransferase